MRKKYYFIVLFVLILSILILGISFSKESSNEMSAVVNEVNNDKLRIIYKNENLFKLNKEFENDITIINNNSSNVRYAIILSEINGKKYENISYVIDNSEVKQVNDKGIIYIGKLNEYGFDNDLIIHHIKIFANNQNSSNYEFSLNIKVINENILDENIIFDENVYQENNNYRYFGNITNNYLKYDNQLYRILGLINDKIRLISEIKEPAKFDASQTYLSIDDYLASYNNKDVNIDNFKNCFSWLNTDVSYYLVDTSNKAYIIDGQNNLVLVNSIKNYNVRNIIEIDSNAKIIRGNGTISNPYEVSYEN